METLKFVNKSPNPNPSFADSGSSGFDLRAWIMQKDGGIWDEDKHDYYIVLKPFERRLFHTGLYFDIPTLHEIQIRSRSGLALKNGVIVLNEPATIDESYTGESGVILMNLSNKDVRIDNNDRIAQGVLCQCINGNVLKLEQTDAITKETDRGSSGFGHTGVK